jgi:O-antigen ligase
MIKLVPLLNNRSLIKHLSLHEKVMTELHCESVDLLEEERCYPKILKFMDLYIHLVTLAVIATGVMTLVNLSGGLFLNLSFGLFALVLIVTLVSVNQGLILTFGLLLVLPEMVLQIHSIFGKSISCLPSPGLDVCLGFIVATSMRMSGSRLSYFRHVQPLFLILVLHFWISISAISAILRNIWQGGSVFSVRGIVFNWSHIRELSWIHDYFPLHNMFVYSIALLILFRTLVLLEKNRSRVIGALIKALFAGFLVNATFGAWQELTGKGFIKSGLHYGINSFWPDLHSFAGLCLITFFVGAAYLRSFPSNFGQKLAIGCVMAISLVTLYFSGSRSGLFLLGLAIIGYCMIRILSSSGRKTVIFGGAIAVVLASFVGILAIGLRGFGFHTIIDLVNQFDFAKFNVALSYRPEFYIAAFTMFSQFPVFGIGEGTFFRLSSVPGFAQSETMLKLGGENAHNFFLQTISELGLVGAYIMVILGLAMWKHGRSYTNIGLSGLLAIALSNIYAHSLLVPEMLIIAAVFFAIYLSERIETLPVNANIRTSSSRHIMTGIKVAGLLLVLAGVSEYAFSFKKFPFEYGHLCFDTSRKYEDKWTSGVFRESIPVGSAHAVVSYLPGHPDVGRRPLSVSISIEGSKGQNIWESTVRYPREVHETQNIRVEVPPYAGEPLSIAIRTSRCFVPLNLGLSLDSRRLGVHLNALELQ